MGIMVHQPSPPPNYRRNGIYFSEYKSYIEISHWDNGTLHRTDGPAIERLYRVPLWDIIFNNSVYFREHPKYPRWWKRYIFINSGSMWWVRGESIDIDKFLDVYGFDFMSEDAIIMFRLKYE